MQMDELEVAQGRSDTSVVQANMILQMSDYNYLQQVIDTAVLVAIHYSTTNCRYKCMCV